MLAWRTCSLHTARKQNQHDNKDFYILLPGSRLHPTSASALQLHSPTHQCPQAHRAQLASNRAYHVCCTSMFARLLKSFQSSRSPCFPSCMVCSCSRSMSFSASASAMSCLNSFASLRASCHLLQTVRKAVLQCRWRLEGKASTPSPQASAEPRGHHRFRAQSICS